jgi:hypothetical protein
MIRAFRSLVFAAMLASTLAVPAFAAPKSWCVCIVINGSCRDFCPSGCICISFGWSSAAFSAAPGAPPSPVTGVSIEDVTATTDAAGVVHSSAHVVAHNGDMVVFDGTTDLDGASLSNSSGQRLTLASAYAAGSSCRGGGP